MAQDRWGFPKLRGTFFGVPVVRTIVLLWSILGSPTFRKLPDIIGLPVPLSEAEKPPYCSQGLIVHHSKGDEPLSVKERVQAGARSFSGRAQSILCSGKVR